MYAYIFLYSYTFIIKDGGSAPLKILKNADLAGAVVTSPNTRHPVKEITIIGAGNALAAEVTHRSEYKEHVIQDSPSDENVTGRDGGAKIVVKEINGEYFFGNDYVDSEKVCTKYIH